MSRVGGITILLSAVLLLPACRSTGNIVQFRNDPTRALPHRSPEKLAESLLADSTPAPTHYSAKADVALRLPDGNKSAKAHVRVRVDSAAWVSVVPALGIEVARLLLTTDSVKLLDKLHDSYWVGTTNQAEQRFGILPSLELLQEALLGKPIGFDPEEKYRSDREEGLYTLTSREKRRFLRAAEDRSPGDTLPDDKDMKERRMERTMRRAERREAIIHKYWLQPDDLTLVRVQISDLVNDQHVDVRFLEHARVNDRLLPARISLTLSDPRRTASGTLTLERISLDGPLQLNFRIPEKFSPMP